MKCYTVVARTLKGEYKSVYLGSDLAEAKKVNREYKTDLAAKDCMAVFFFPKPYSKRVCGIGHQFDHDAKIASNKKREEEKAKEQPKPKKKKEDK